MGDFKFEIVKCEKVKCTTLGKYYVLKTLGEGATSKIKLG